MEAKPIWLSKTLWVNVLAIIAIVIQIATGEDSLNPEVQMVVLGAINVALRLITNQPVVWK